MVEAITKKMESDVYGFSKACLNVWMMQQAAAHPELLINNCTPGFIATDMTKDLGATNTTDKGTVAPLYLIFGDAENVGTGRFYGSDAVRSPLDRYRGPGDPPYNP